MIRAENSAGKAGDVAFVQYFPVTEGLRDETNFFD
jgi:hypothetical protein